MTQETTLLQAQPPVQPRNGAERRAAGKSLLGWMTEMAGTFPMVLRAFAVAGVLGLVIASPLLTMVQMQYSRVALRKLEPDPAQGTWSAEQQKKLDDVSKIVRENDTKLVELTNNIASPVYTGVVGLLSGLLGASMLLQAVEQRKKS